MPYITECDDCKTVYEGGFKGKKQKNITRKGKEFKVEIKITPNLLCTKCFKVIMREVIKG